MSYNKAQAEKKWLKWKNAEEQQLREMGVDEEIIQRLHTYDWEVFKSDRKYYEKLSDTNLYSVTEEKSRSLYTVQELLNEIENEHLYTALQAQDEMTLEIVLYKLDGFTNDDISKKCGISANAVKLRMWKFKKKLKKFL